MQPRPEAIFDTLYVGSRVQEITTDFSLFEIQFFSYLSCLLSMYDGAPASNWGYNFIKSEFASPYSADLHSGWEFLLKKGAFEEPIEGYTKVTSIGQVDIEFYLTLNSFRERQKVIDAACKVLAFIPIGYIKEALYNEPVLKSSKILSRHLLLEENSSSYKVLYEQFQLLRAALENKYTNLTVPAVVWIGALESNIRENNE